MGTHPIFESDFDCLTESAPFARVTEMNSQVHCRLMRLTVARFGIKQRLGQLIPSPVANYYHKWRSADESWKRTRFMVLCSTYMVVYFTYHMAHWSCLPPRVEMPP